MTREFDLEVIDIIDRTSDVKSFRFKIESGIDFSPGQYFFLTIFTDGKELMKPFSFSNSPTEQGYIEFTKRITPSEFSQALSTYKKGDKVRMKLPYGKFIFRGEFGKVAFLSGGIGITPFRSICKYAQDNQLGSDIILLYSNKEEDNIVFKHDFIDMQKNNPNFHVIFTLTCPESLIKSRLCRKGFINGEMIKQEIPDYNERIFYLCGPPAMVKSLKTILQNELTLPKEKIKTELFVGY